MLTRTFSLRSLLALLLCSALGAFAQAPGTIVTVAGNGTFGYNGDDIAATTAWVGNSVGVAVDSAGNLYIADETNRRLRKVTAATGKISTIAGTGVFGFNGDNISATTAQLGDPRGIFVDSQGNIYLTDLGTNRVRKINSSGIITTIAGTGVSGYNGDGAAASLARLAAPSGVVVDALGNLIFADSANNRIRKITSDGNINTIAGTGVSGYNGDGPATSAQLNAPQGLAIDSAGNIYFCDEANQRIRELTTTGQVATVAGTGTGGYNGDGPALSTQLSAPFGIALDSRGALVFADALNRRVRKLSPDRAQITTIAGTGVSGYNGDGIAATSAELSEPGGIAIDSAGNIYVTDVSNLRVREIIAPDGSQTYYFSQLVFAGGFQTTLTYINYSQQSITCTTNFYDDGGHPLPIPFSSDLGATRVDVLPPGGSVHDSTTASLTDAVTEGWAQASCTGPVQTGLLYRLYTSGIPVSEASVNAETSATTEFATFAQAGRSSTGIAYANPSPTQTATVTITAYNNPHVNLGSKTFTLGPMAHGSANVAPLLSLPRFTGFVEITSSIPIVSLSLNAESFPIFSSLPPGDLASGTPLVGIAPPGGSSSPHTYYFSHLAFGGGFETTLTYINYSTHAVTCNTHFYDDLGQPLQLTFGSDVPTATRSDLMLAGDSVHVSTSPGTTFSGSPSQGWAQASCNGSVQAGLSYRYFPVSDTPAGEASVNAEAATTTEFSTFAQTATGVAYANPSATQSANVTITAYDASGTKLNSHVVTLGPMQHGSANIGTMLGITSFTGFMKVTSSIPIASLSLNAEAFPVFSSLPPGDLPSSTALVQ